MYVLIITGLSGAGKSHALKKMEDSGYFCVDNLPLSLVNELVGRLSGVEGIERIALGIDSRNTQLGHVHVALDSLRDNGNQVEVLFLDARDDVLLRRYSETRRNHPMAREGFVADGIARERETLRQLRKISTYYIDTSEKKPAELYEEIEKMLGEYAQGFSIMIRSFGYKHGIAADADIMIDVRFLPNPFWIGELRALTGQDKPVMDYVLGFPQTQEFLHDFSEMITKLLPYYLKEGKPRLLIAIGCTGGQHRSVCVAEALAVRFRAKGIETLAAHRDLSRH